MSDHVRQVAMPDKQQLSELLLKAKGPQRTMAEFSQAAGINTSTLSRIATAKIIRPLPYDVLDKIYKHKDERADYSFNTLLLANGMTNAETNDLAKPMTQKLIDQETALAIKRHAKNIMINALLERGFSVQSVPRDTINSRENECPSGIYAPYDFAFYVSGAPEEAWYFITMEVASDGYTIIKRDLNRAYRVFLLDSWHPEFLAGQRNSFVFSNETAFQSFVRDIQGKPKNSAISAILIDTQGETFIKECWLTNWVEPSNSALKQPIADDRGLIAVHLDDEAEWA